MQTEDSGQPNTAIARVGCVIVIISPRPPPWAGLCISVQEDGSVVGEDNGERVGCQHGVIDDSTCANVTEL